MCTACRFSKCLGVGMSPDLIRKEDLTGKTRSSIKPKQQQQVVATKPSAVCIECRGFVKAFIVDILLRLMYL